MINPVSFLGDTPGLPLAALAAIAAVAPGVVELRRNRKAAGILWIACAAAYVLVLILAKLWQSGNYNNAVTPGFAWQLAPAKALAFGIAIGSILGARHTRLKPQWWKEFKSWKSWLHMRATLKDLRAERQKYRLIPAVLWINAMTALIVFTDLQVLGSYANSAHDFWEGIRDILSWVLILQLVVFVIYVPFATYKVRKLANQPEG